jgi:hypothetical protein
VLNGEYQLCLEATSVTAFPVEVIDAGDVSGAGFGLEVKGAKGAAGAGKGSFLFAISLVTIGC